jgi:putative nucleotidyltransferase with HDIG domain
MLKRIETHQVRAGMFVEAIEGAWHDKTWQKHRFLLTGDAIVQRLKASSAGTVVINTARGSDVCAGARQGEAEPDVERMKVDAAAALQTVQQSSQLLGNLFSNASVSGAVTISDAADIVGDISKSIDRNPSVFVSVTRLKSKDETTFVHSISVSALLIHFGRYLGLDEATVQLLGMGGLLHDIGKLEVPSAILNKNGSLEPHELALMRCHPDTGHRILSRQEGMPAMVLDICRHHHERIDGKGYPARLSGADFTLYARMASICDVYDAVTSARPYKKPWSAGEALAWMLKRDGQFDRRLLKKFALCLSITLARPA